MHILLLKILNNRKQSDTYFFWIDYLQYSKFGQRVLKTSYVRKRLCVCKIQVCIIIPFLKKNLCVIYFTDNIQIPSSHCGLLEEKHCRRQLRCLTKIILCYFKDFDSGLMIERFAYNLRYSLQTKRHCHTVSNYIYMAIFGLYRF